MNRPLRAALAALLALLALGLTTGCDDGDTADPTPPANDAGPPDAPDPIVPDVFFTLSAAARACEVMLFDPDRQLGDAAFADAVEGRSLRRGDRLALAFAHRADAAITVGSVGLVARDGIAAVSVESAVCFDREGRPLADAALALSAR